MTRATQRVIAMPADPKARRERRWKAWCTEIDRLEARIREIRTKELPALQLEVSRDLGYRFTVSRPELELAIKARDALAEKEAALKARKP